MLAGSDSDQGAVPGSRELRRPLVPGHHSEVHVREALRLSRRIPLSTCRAWLPGEPNCTSAKRRRRSLGCDGSVRPTLPEVQLEVRAGPAMNPSLTIARLRPSRSSDNPTAAPGGERLIGGLRKAKVLEE